MTRDEIGDDEARLESGLRGLRDAYLGVVPRDNADDVARRVMAARSGIPAGTRAIPGRLRGAMAGFAGLAAAAALLVVFARRANVMPASAAASRTVTGDAAASAIAVEVPEGHDAIVFNTSNPLISVVWIH